MKIRDTWPILVLTFISSCSNNQKQASFVQEGQDQEKSTSMLGVRSASLDYQDISFFSEAFKTNRMYRVYLPHNYADNRNKRYPVIYYFHGYGGRYKWDGYDLADDIHYPENGRKEPPFVMEWSNYSKTHDVIIITWDGYEPNLHPGKKNREGIPYGNALPYDYVRAHDKEDHHWGWDYRLYFRDLVKHVDSNFRTIADRDHRAITGLSMGGLTAYYIAGQNKDLVSSVSSFDPADNLPRYGPKGKQAVFPILQLYRPLKGLSVRLTMTDGDWLKYNDWELNQIFGAADLSHFESHMADYPDHWAADIDKQLDFHMSEFLKSHPIPDNWDHVCPAFPSFQAWDYHVTLESPHPALAILENVSLGHMKALLRDFVPDGPIVRDESLHISTAPIYSPKAPYRLAIFNLSNGKIRQQPVIADDDGRLNIEVGRGGNLIGINGKGPGNGPKLRMVFSKNQEYFYFEEGVVQSLDFKLVNVGEEEARNIEITASSTHPNIHFENDAIKVSRVPRAGDITLKDQFKFNITHHSDSSFAGSMSFEVKVNNVVQDTQPIMFFTLPKAPFTKDGDLIVLDGRTARNIPVYLQGPNIVRKQDLSGGQGNGNGILEPGENALFYIRLPRGMASNDLHTYHRTYLLNHLDDPFISVKKLDYEEKLNQASATSISTVVSLTKGVPDQHPLNLLFKVESLYNDKADSTSRADIYAHHYDYRRVSLKVNK